MKIIGINLIIIIFYTNSICSQINISKESDYINKTKKNIERLKKNEVEKEIGFFFPEQVLLKNELFAYKKEPIVKYKKKQKKKFLEKLIKVPEEKNILKLRTVSIEKIANKKYFVIGIKTKNELNGSNYNFIKNNTEFKVSDFSKIEKFEEERYLELKSLENFEIILISLKKSIKNFIIKKDYDNLIKKYLNKEVLVFTQYTEKVWNLEKYGEKIVLPKKSTWYISDITYLIESLELVYILENENFGKIKYIIDLTQLNSLFQLTNQSEKHNIRYYNKIRNKFWFVLKEEYMQKQLLSQKKDSIKLLKIKELSTKNKKQLIEKYGGKFGNLIYNNKVSIGMSEEMVEKSLGNFYTQTNIIEKDFNYSVWKYYNKILYFKDKKVVKIIEQN